MPEMFGFDAYSPKEISRCIEIMGASKVHIPWLSTLILGVLAGGFMNNLVPAILGNLVGGSLMVGPVYHVIYRRAKPGQTS